MSDGSRQHTSALVSSAGLKRPVKTLHVKVTQLHFPSESVCLPDALVLRQWSGIINSTVTWRESNREIPAHCSGRNQLMKRNKRDPHRPLLLLNLSAGPLVGLPGVSALLNATYPPVRSNGLVWGDNLTKHPAEWLKGFTLIPMLTDLS